MLNVIYFYNYNIDMSAQIATHHRGDGGADPPPNPTQLPSQCQSGNVFLYILFHAKFNS